MTTTTNTTTTTDNTDNTTAQRLPLAPPSARPLPTLAAALIAVKWGSNCASPYAVKRTAFRASRALRRTVS